MHHYQNINLSESIHHQFLHIVGIRYAFATIAAITQHKSVLLILDIYMSSSVILGIISTSTSIQVSPYTISHNI